MAQPSIGTGLLALGSAVAITTGWSAVGVGLGLWSLYSGARSAHYYWGRLRNREVEDSKYQASILYSQTYSRRLHDLSNDHVTLGLKEDGKLKEAYGLWVAQPGEKGPLSFYEQSEIRDDSEKYNAEAGAEMLINITKEQYDRILSRILRDKSIPPRFDYTSNFGLSCVSWAHSVMRDAGVTLTNSIPIKPPEPADLVKYATHKWDRFHSKED